MTEAVLRFDDSALRWREIDGEIVVLDLAGGTYFSINAAGACLWRALAVGTKRSDLVTLLAKEYELPDDQAARDVDAFLESCREKKLLIET